MQAKIVNKARSVKTALLVLKTILFSYVYFASINARGVGKVENELTAWAEQIKQTKLPRWEELPELELYMDQVITLVDRYLAPLLAAKKEYLLSSAMVNNYVKHKLIPAPVKKRYNRNHLAYLIAITLLKQVLAIPDIKELIELQLEKEAPQAVYNYFCLRQEEALTHIADLVLGRKVEVVLQTENDFRHLALDSATWSFANQTLVEKLLEIERAGADNE